MRQRWVKAALETLGVDHLALILFDAAFPQHSQWDVGSGSPYSTLARDLLRFVHDLGFNGVQFGPQGATSRDNPSPYDSTAFSRNPLAIAFDQLSSVEGLSGADSAADGGVLPGELVANVLRDRPPGAAAWAQHAYAFQRHGQLMQALLLRLKRAATLPAGAELRDRFEGWRRQQADWLLADGLHELVCGEYGVGDMREVERIPTGAVDAQLWHADWRRRANPHVDPGTQLLGYLLPPLQRERLLELKNRYARRLEDYAWAQFIVHEQHHALHTWATQLGLELYGDVHVGYSRRDGWHFRSVFLTDYCLGAPPSRTNPEGQPWGCPVLDPALYSTADDALGPALALVDRRVAKLFSEYDRLRIDHPHGLICPWVYKSNSGDDLRAVQAGARLFSSPDLPDHPALARYAVSHPRDLDRSEARHADRWVRQLTQEQVRRYARCFDVLVERARARGSVDRLICEVLSTQPNELGAVLGLYGLGRFRVTQKANVLDPSDVYLSENAKATDWMLMGNHDTPPIWSVAERWQPNARGAQARYLAGRLARDENQRQLLEQRLQGDVSELVHAKLADLFVGEARSVLVSFGDLFGFQEPYNVPGTISEGNWSQRVPRDFTRVYWERVRMGSALDLARSLRLALQRVAPGSELLHHDPESLG